MGTMLANTDQNVPALAEKTSQSQFGTVTPIGDQEAAW
jgi:hypothetical protein